MTRTRALNSKWGLTRFWHKKRLFLLTICVTVLVSIQGAMVFGATYTQPTYLEKLNRLTGQSFPSDYHLRREDFCVILAKLLVKNNIVPNTNAITLPFVDLNQINTENIPDVKLLYDNGILCGALNNGALYMNPDAEVTEWEANAFISRILPDTAAYLYEDAQTTEGTETTLTAEDGAALVIFAYNLQQIADADITDYAGIGLTGYADGSADTAQFRQPGSVTAVRNDSGEITDALVVFDKNNNAVREVKEGVVTTLTGVVDGVDKYRMPEGGYKDDRTEVALLNRPSGGVYNSKGELIFSDTQNNVLRIVQDGVVSTYCGSTLGEAGFADGAKDVARFNRPTAIAIDQNDNVYVTDTLNDCVRMVDKNGNVTTLAGTEASFREPEGIAVTADGATVYVSDTGNHKIRKIENGVVTDVAGAIGQADEDGYPIGDYRDGQADQAMFSLPKGITLVGEGLVVADSGNNRLRAVTLSGNVITLAGTGEPDDVIGKTAESMFNSPMGVYFVNNQLYIVDTNNNKIKVMHIEADWLQ